MEDAVRLYRQECRIERLFDRLKNRLNIAPMYVTEPDQVKGLNHLLTLGVRTLTRIEFVVRRSLEREKKAFPGLHPENIRKTTNEADQRTQFSLKAFEITLTIIHLKDNPSSYASIRTQKEILNRLQVG